MGLRADPAVAEIFQPEEDEVDGSFFSFKLPGDLRQPSFKGSVEAVVDAITWHDYGNVNIGLPPATKHPAYDELANIEGDPQPVPEFENVPDLTYILPKIYRCVILKN